MSVMLSIAGGFALGLLVAFVGFKRRRQVAEGRHRPSQRAPSFAHNDFNGAAYGPGFDDTVDPDPFAFGGGDDMEDLEAGAVHRVPARAAESIGGRRRHHKTGRQQSSLATFGDPTSRAALTTILDDQLGPAELDEDREEAANRLEDDSEDEGAAIAADTPADSNSEAEAAVVPATAVAPGPPVVLKVPRIDFPDNFVLLGDVPQTVHKLADTYYLPLMLKYWATRFLVPLVAVTELLRLFHGNFGQTLGVNSRHIKRGGTIPATAVTLFKYADKVTKELGLNLLSPGEVPLPNDDNLRVRGTKHAAEYYYSPDLAITLALKLMNPALNSQVTPFYYDMNPTLPPGVYCGPTYFSPEELAERLIARDRALVKLPTVLARDLPGVDPAKVGIIAVLCNLFVDSVCPYGNQASSIHVSLISPTSWHPAVANSPEAVAVTGLWIPPTVLRATKVAQEDTSKTASPATKFNHALVTAQLYKHAVADPMLALYTREPLIVRAKDLQGLPIDYPHQYVALTFGPAHISGDLPELSYHCGHTENHCPVDGTFGAGLSEIPEGLLSGGPVPVPIFGLPTRFNTKKVATSFQAAFLSPADSEEAKNAKEGLKEKFFNALIPPPILFIWWNAGISAASDFFGRIIYDTLHCFDIGLLDYFMDAVEQIIYNCNGDTERGNKAVGLFEARLASIPCFDTGLRLYRAFPGGFMRRAICSGNDRFFLILMFVAAIGLDNAVIAEEALRRKVLRACEAAAVVATLLRAEALTSAARTLVYESVRSFLKYLKEAVFLERQKSQWQLLKFHMLLHIVNWTSVGAPGCTNSSKFEAALRIYVSRIVKFASSNQNVLRDIARYVMQHALFTLLSSKAGPFADNLSQASLLPKRRRLLDRCAETPEGMLTKPVKAPAGEYIRAISEDWASVPGNAGRVAGTNVDWTTARFFERVYLPRLGEDFAANVNLRAVVELNPLSTRYALTPAVKSPEAIRADPAIAKLGRIVSLFYLPAPLPGVNDGFLDDASRVFVLVHPFQEQSEAEKGRLHGLKYFSIRSPLPPQRRLGAGANEPRPPPFLVFPLRDVLRAVRAFPVDWPIWMSTPLEARRRTTEREQRQDAAKCETGAVLLFWMPLQGMHLA